MQVYLASPFFNETENANVGRAEEILRNRGLTVWSPREHEDREHDFGSREWSEAIFQADRQAIHDSDVVVLLYYGDYSDSGTAWECGYAYALGKPVIVVHLGDCSNLMAHEGSHANLDNITALENYDFLTLPTKPFEGKMI